MADIRINALPTTATDFASDDYIAIDGTTNGTRKLNAKTANLTFSDVTLGTSGPSVKSTLSARAPRQGLVFDGTTGGSFTLTSAPSGSWSTEQTALIPTANPSSAIGLFAIGGTYSTDATYAMYISAGGALVVEQNTAAPSSFRTASISGFRSAYSGKTVRIATTVSSSTLTIYVNGVSASYSETTTGGSPPAWGATLGSATSYYGKLTASQYYFNSVLGPLYTYNRALSASEVVALYEAGAPSGADYNSASNTAINTSNWDNSNWPYTSYTGVSSTGFTAVMSTVNVGIAEIVPTPVNGTTGQRIRVTFSATLTSGVTPTLRLLNAAYTTVSNAVALTAGSNTVELIATAPFTKIGFYTSGVTSYAVSGISVVRAGLVLAPDAAQAGGGLVWYDTSGNAANITLPASGVRWNVPSSGYWGGNLTISKSSTTTGPVLQLENTNDAIDAGGTLGRLQFYSGDDSGGGNSVRAWIDSIQTTATPAGSALRFAVANGANAAGEVLRIAETGNLLLKTDGIDSANGKLQLATHTTSAGGIGFGTVTSLYASSVSGCLELAAASGTTGGFKLYNTTNQRGQFVYSGTDVYIDASTLTGQLIFRTNGSTTALTLDSSQNATFAGAVTAQQLNAVDAAANNRSAAIIRAQNNTTYSSSVLSVQGDRTTTNSSYNLILAQNAAVTGQFIVRDSGNVLNTNNSYGAISDRKLKENIVDTAPKLAQIAKIQIRDYNLIGKTETQTGVIAQELETVFPSLVESFIDRDAAGNDLGTVTKTVKYSQLVPFLVKALQELHIDFETYKAAHP